VVRSTRPIFWIFVPLLVSLTVLSLWATIHFGPIGKPSQEAAECNSVRELIISEELSGRTAWVEYRNLVDDFLALPPNSEQRITLIESMALKVVEVLSYDLTIYEELEKFPKCVTQSKREQIPGMIEETNTAINFLSGSTAIEGNYFDPELGTWNSSYYEEYLSALEYLKSQYKNQPSPADF